MVEWAAINEELFCPRCGYNLRGLERGLCPECGLTFEWDDILDPRRRAHPYLYEHHDGKRRLRRFIKTSLRGLWPWSFWRGVTLEQRSEPRRLAAFMVLSWILLVVVDFAVDTFVVLARYHAIPRFVGGIRFVAKTSTPVESFDWCLRYIPRQLRAKAGLGREYSEIRAFLNLCYMSYPLASALALFLYWRSRRRFRVLPHHLWRSGIYSWTASAIWIPGIAKCLYGLWVCSLDVWRFTTDPLWRGPLRGYWWQLSVGRFRIEEGLLSDTIWLVPLLVWFLISLWIAGQRYMWLPKGWTLALLTTQVAVLLFYCNAIFLFLYIDATRLSQLTAVYRWLKW